MLTPRAVVIVIVSCLYVFFVVVVDAVVKINKCILIFLFRHIYSP